MKNRKTILTATVLVLGFAPIIQAGPRPDGGPVYLSATPRANTFSIGLSWPTLAQNPLSEVQFQDPSLVGTWRSGKFAYTFFDDGRYVYVGAIETTYMSTTISEKGTYTVNGDQ